MTSVGRERLVGPFGGAKDGRGLPPTQVPDRRPVNIAPRHLIGSSGRRQAEQSLEDLRGRLSLAHGGAQRCWAATRCWAAARCSATAFLSGGALLGGGGLLGGSGLHGGWAPLHLWFVFLGRPQGAILHAPIGGRGTPVEPASGPIQAARGPLEAGRKSRSVDERCDKQATHDAKVI